MMVAMTKRPDAMVVSRSDENITPAMINRRRAPHAAAAGQMLRIFAPCHPLRRATQTPAMVVGKI
jgi:hypothetical protein